MTLTFVSASLALTVCELGVTFSPLGALKVRATSSWKSLARSTVISTSFCSPCLSVVVVDGTTRRKVSCGVPVTDLVWVPVAPGPPGGLFSPQPKAATRTPAKTIKDNLYIGFLHKRGSSLSTTVASRASGVPIEHDMDGPWPLRCCEISLGAPYAKAG